MELTLHIPASIDLKSCRANKVEGPFAFHSRGALCRRHNRTLDHVVAIGGDDPRHPEATFGEQSAMLALGPFVSARPHGMFRSINTAAKWSTWVSSFSGTFDLS